MDEVDFSDFASVEAWFEGQTPEVRSTMASRAALRVTANLGMRDGKGADTLTLKALRCMLTSAVRSLGRTADREWLDSAAQSAAHSAAPSTDLVNFALSSARSAALSAQSARSAAYSVRSAAFSNTLSARSTTYSATAWDILNVEINLISQQLWAGADVPDNLLTQHPAFLSVLRINPDWDFFRTWYEQMWDGTFTDWDLATEVAKIDGGVWDAGLADLAETIRGIEAQRGLLEQITGLRQTTQAVEESEFPPSRGHNNPPELIQEPQLAKQVEIVWAALDTLEQEAAAEEPNQSKAKSALVVIKDWFFAACKYVLRKVDLAIDTTIKWGIPVVGGGYLATHPAHLQKIIELAELWLKP